MSHGTSAASSTVFSKDPGWRRWLYLGSRPCHCELQGAWIVFRTGDVESRFLITSVQSVSQDRHRSVAVRLLDDGGARDFWFILRGDAATAMAGFSQFAEALQKDNPAVEITMQW
jgi:hypothetical protein